MQEQLRVWYTTNLSPNKTYIKTSSLTQAYRTIDHLCKAHLMNFAISSDSYGLEILKDRKWSEWEYDGTTIAAKNFGLFPLSNANL